MIVADTNVYSEPLKREPNRRVLAWIEQAADELAITSVSVGELLFGAERLPEGRRRRQLFQAIDHLIDDAGESVLSFDSAAARAYALLRARAQRVGRGVGSEDLMIASICVSRDATLATRNVRDFDGLGIALVDPWTAELGVTLA